ncbi:MAG: methyltransferase domain-containing protein [Rhodospirillaceae bacterium]|jgi:SAM-dependent methyltransferase|nr:methyltransferase domain-containing protein [Rhodospirillaceae bacterium]MBT4937861.1 methyltransferase domain-containing protein [Rhodospirillaceae bacterium]MBT5941136.1 methyltransferase domain-containing protein [Rhodospirillaceae bacterium]MBT7266322.1 methyltransferase domain-containing protein [Rhodospirillaceae bacterium]
MTNATSTIQTHYGSNDLVDRILSALEKAGNDTSNLTVEMLNLVDQLHGGGLKSTIAQAGMVQIGKDTKVFDAGCGVGGSSRYIANAFGCQIEAIDLTPEYVETAQRLNKLCGLDDKISVNQGDVTDLSQEDQSFDLVWCQNVTMNVEDKAGMFAEAYRVLVPGGQYTFSHAAGGPNGEPYFPLPWAMDPAYSFVSTPEIIVQSLEEAGFTNIETRSEARSSGNAAGRPTSEVGQSVIMGDDMPERQSNAMRSGKEGRLIGMLVTAERPA